MLMVVKNQIKVSLLSIKYNIMKNMTNKSSFLFSVLLMFLSNASFLVQWIIILSNTSGDITMREVLLIWGLAAASFGVYDIIFNGISKLPDYIIYGSLDAYLVQPKNVLLQVATSNISISGFGDMLYGYIIVLIVSFKISTLFYLIMLSFMGALIYASFLVILYSMIFFSVSFKEIASSLYRIPTSFATYPEKIFKGFLKVLFYTIIPIGFIIYMPVNFLLTNKFKFLLITILFCIIIVSLAFILFNKGLKKYSSGNLMNQRN